jgi:arylformamidase
MNQKYKIHDISMVLHDGMLMYPSDVPYHRQLQRDMEQEGRSNVSFVEMSAHTGSHVDAPRHYYADGYGVEAIPLDYLYGPAQVIDCRGMRAVTAEVLQERVAAGAERLLLKTDCSQWLKENPDGPFRKDFVYLDGGGAEFLVERGIKLVGIDYLSIDQSGVKAKSAHHTLLKNNIVILEGIVLADVEPGVYFLSCGPLKMAGSDGAPARVVLIEM